MSLTPTNHVHGVLHIIVDATGNNSLHTFLILFTDLNWGGGGGVASHGTPGPVYTLPFGRFCFPNCTHLFIVYYYLFS